MRELFPVITCEHAGNRIPIAFAYLFQDAKGNINSHKGWDIGALFWAERLAKHLGTDLFSYEYTRLLIEVNRSEHSDQLYSKYSAELPDSTKKYLLETYYRPYRRKVRQHIEHLLDWDKNVLHVSVHSFSPIWDGKERAVEIGLLFDEEREEEAAFCQIWKERLNELHPDLKIRFNEPYLGKDDGFCTRLRGKFPVENYFGIELEVNQKFVVSDQEWISEILNSTLKLTIDDYQNSRSGGGTR